eukprot:5538559-Amphidinium_carterae.1
MLQVMNLQTVLPFRPKFAALLRVAKLMQSSKVEPFGTHVANNAVFRHILAHSVIECNCIALDSWSASPSRTAGLHKKPAAMTDNPDWGLPSPDASKAHHKQAQRTKITTRRWLLYTLVQVLGNRVRKSGTSA